MATYVRQGTGTLPSNTDGHVTGTIELDSTTAPGDFAPGAINSVRIQYRMEVGSGTFISPEDHTVLRNVELTLDGVGTAMALVDGTNIDLDNGTSPIDTDETDSSPGQGFSTAQWESAELNPGDIAAVRNWTTFNQNMSKDGVLIQVASTGLIVTVTIDYTPATLAVFTQNAFRFRTNDTPGLNDNAGGDWEALLDTNVSLIPDIIFRLRVEIEGITNAETEGFQLRVQKNGSGGYLLIPNNATPHDTPSTDGQKRIQAVPSEAYTDLAATTDILSASAHTFIAGDGNDDNTTGTVAFTAPSHTEMEWALLVRKLSEDEHIIDTDFFEFRVYRDDGTVLDNYDVTPRITVLNDPGHIGGTRVETPGRNWVATAEGVLYTILEYTDITTKNRVVMMKSTDGGDSWNPVDEAGAPTQNDLEACDLDYIAGDNTIFIIIQGETNDDVLYWTFRTSNHASPDTWDIDQNIDVASSVGLSQKVAIARRDGDSTTVAFYMDNDGSNDIIRYRILTGSTWGGELTLDAEASREFRGVVVTRESDDTLHIFYLREDPGVLTEVYHRTMDPSDDSLSGRTQVDQTAVMANATNSGHAPIGQPRIWDDGGTIRVGVAYQDGSRDGYWNQSIVTTMDFTNEALITTETMHWNGGGSHAWDGDCVVDDNLDEPWAFWVRDSNDNLNSNHEVSGSWGSDVNERTGIHHAVSLNIFVHNGGNGGARVIGLMTESNPNAAFSGGTGSVFYFEPVTLASIGQTIAVGILGETNALVSAGVSIFKTIGTMAEAEALISAGPIKVAPITTLGETDSLVTAAPEKFVSIGTLAEVEALISAGVSIYRTVGTLPEIDALLPTPPVEEQIIAVTTLAEIEALIAIQARKIASVGVLAETDALIPADPVKPIITAVGVMPETDALIPAVVKQFQTIDIGTLATGGVRVGPGVADERWGTGTGTDWTIAQGADHDWTKTDERGSVDLSIVSGEGLVDNFSTGYLRAHILVDGGSEADVEVLFECTTVSADALAVMLRRTGSTTYYHMGLSGDNFLSFTENKLDAGNGVYIAKRVSGVTTILAQTDTFSGPGSADWNIRARVNGPYLKVKAWQGAEPAAWDLEVFDNELAAAGGYGVGVGSNIVSATYNFSQFTASEAIGSGPRPIFAQFEPQTIAVTTLAETDALIPTPPIKVAVIGTLTETDGLVSITGIKTADVGTLAETDSLIVVAVVQPGAQNIAVTTLAELETLIAIQAIKLVPIGTLAETDALEPVGVSIFETIGTLTEIESLLPVGVSIFKTIGTLAEIESLIAIQASKIADIGTLSEVDALIAIAAEKIAIIGTLAETDSLVPVGVSIYRFVGTLAEIDALISIDFEGIQVIAVATLAEIDALVAIEAVKPIITSVGTLAEIESLLAIAGIKIVNIGTLGEADSLISAQPVKPIFQPVGTLSEADSLLAIQTLKIANIGTLAEIDTLISAGVSIYRTIGTLAEFDSLLTIPAVKPIFQAVGTLLEADGLIVVQPEKPIITSVGTMAQVDSLVAIGALKPIFTPVGTLAETETLIAVSLILGQPVALFMKVTSKHYDSSVTSKEYDPDQTSTVEGTP